MKTQDARQAYIGWLQSAKDLAPNTLRAYDSDLKMLCRHMGPDTRVQDLSGTVILAFIEAQRGAGLSPASIRRRLSTLRAFSRWLVSNRVLHSDPWSQVSVRVRKSRILPRAVPPSDLKRLLLFLSDAAGVSSSGVNGQVSRPNEMTTLLAVALMIATGLRVCEVVGIRYLEVDTSAHSIRVMGKGSRERTVFLPDHWTLNLLDSYLEARRKLGVDHERLFFNSSGKPLTEATIRTRLAQVSKEAGLRGRLTPHMLRHSAATQLIESGVDIRYVQRLLGHASLSTTEIYTHVSDLALRRVVSKADVLGNCLSDNDAVRSQSNRL